MPKKSGYKVTKESTNDESVYSDISDNDSSSISSENNKYVSNKNRSQKNLTKEDIRTHLKGYRALKTSEDKKYILTLKPYKVWIKYFNITTREFRIGGLLKVIDPKLRFIMLTNTQKKFTWSVQLKDCIIFVPDKTEDTTTKEDTTEDTTEDITENTTVISAQAQKEQSIKDKLYKLYLQNRLSLTTNKA